MRFRNHPLHPVVAIFPLSLLAASLALDTVALVSRDVELFAAARWALGAASIAGMIAAVPGIADMLAYPRPARTVPLRHGVLNGAAIALMALGWWLRGAPAAEPQPAVLVVSAVAAALAAIAWRMGARLTPPR